MLISIKIISYLFQFPFIQLKKLSNCQLSQGYKATTRKQFTFFTSPHEIPVLISSTSE